MMDGQTHRQKDVAQVEQAMYDRADSTKTCDVARDDQADAQNVMGEHLPMIATPFLGVDHVDLVEPPAELGEIVELCESWEVNDGICAPQRFG